MDREFSFPRRNYVESALKGYCFSSAGDSSAKSRSCGGLSVNPNSNSTQERSPGMLISTQSRRNASRMVSIELVACKSIKNQIKNQFNSESLTSNAANCFVKIAMLFSRATLFFSPISEMQLAANISGLLPLV